jgi:hypothetical protein
MVVADQCVWVGAIRLEGAWGGLAPHTLRCRLGGRLCRPIELAHILAKRHDQAMRAGLARAPTDKQAALQTTKRSGFRLYAGYQERVEPFNLLTTIYG